MATTTQADMTFQLREEARRLEHGHRWSQESLAEFVVEEALPKGFQHDAFRLPVPRAICQASRRCPGQRVVQGLYMTPERIFVVHGCCTCGQRWIPDRDKTRIVFQDRCNAR